MTFSASNRILIEVLSLSNAIAQIYLLQDNEYLASLLADREKETSALKKPETYLKKGESQKSVDGELVSIRIEFWHCWAFSLVFMSF